jgi:hypothetical protein
VSQQAFYEQVQRREEWEAAHPLPTAQELDADKAFVAALADKFPQLRAWPGQQKKSPVLSSGNGLEVSNAVKYSAKGKT